jgi:antirestriction protein
MTNTNNIRVYIANLGKYNEGFLVGQWIDLPCTEEELQQLYVNIGVGFYRHGEYIHGLEVDGVVYEEYAIHDYESNIEGISIGEYENLEALNRLADSLNDLDESELQKLQAGINCFGYEPSDIADRLDDFILYSDIHTEYDLGYYWIEESGCYDTSKMGILSHYIDYKAFGRDIALESNGGFTDWGFIEEGR